MNGRSGASSLPVVNFSQMSNTRSYTTPDQINAPTFSNPPFKLLGGTTAPIPTDGLIQRGYMRLLTEVFEYGPKGTTITSVGEALSHDLGTKLDFQFNPAELTRSVVARTDTQLWINQSPSQLLQPGIGDMSFTWQMLFNRESEVQKGDVAGRLKKDWEFETFGSRLDQFSAENAAGSDEAAQELGVLADIAILDRITGQSISAEAIAYAQARYERLVISGAITEEDAVDEENSIVVRAEANPDMKNSLMDANIQNSAFLVPNPIRVVFSENFMVDGYVNSVTVSFKKFSTQMVPTVALVDVSMHAIYQGFSRYKSTFTTLLDLSQTEVEKGKVKVPDAGTSVSTLQDAGRNAPVLGGFDHSPPVDVSWTEFNWRFSNADVIPKNPATKLEMHKHDEATGSQTVDGQEAKAFKIDKGISFGILSRLSDGTELAEALRKQYGIGNLSISDLSASVSTGLRIRARLRPHQPGSGSGSSTTAQDAMDALLSGGDDGFTDYDRDSVFFGKWPLEQRHLLLGAGDGSDNAPTRLSLAQASAIRFDTFTNQTAPGYNPASVSTRSFPIITCESGSGILPPDTYGDLLGMHTADYAPGEVEVTDHWIWLEWRDWDDARKWKEEDTLYYVGEGFYASSDNESFPSEITIPHATTTVNDLVFKVDYQMHLLFRTELNYQGFLLSDTGWRRLHSRSENSAMIPEGGLNPLNRKSMNLNGNLVGNITSTSLLDNTFPWQHDQRGTKQHFDGHIAHSGCTKWTKQETSAAATGNHYDVSDIRVYISSTSTQGYT